VSTKDERVLDVQALNRALLARQLLLRRHKLPVHRAIERVGALQAQWPPSPYIGLWSRLEGFRRETLMRAIEGRRVVKATLMRMTLHHVSAADYLAYGGVFTEAWKAWLARRAERTGVELDFDALAEQLVAEVAEEPRWRPELLRALGLPKLDSVTRQPWTIWGSLVMRAQLVHGPSSSVWRVQTGRSTFVPASSWLGSGARSGTDAVQHLVRRNLAAFGPATRADIAQWTGLPVAMIAPSLHDMRLRRFRDEPGREQLDLPRAPLPAADTPAPPRFLPMWDSTLLAHDDRTRILPERYRATVIRRNGDVRQTFLVDGFVAGLWELQEGRVELEPFEPLPRSAERELRREAKRLASFAPSWPTGR
jgi:hypothetical protein